DDVASHGELAAAAERIAGDRGNDRLATARDSIEGREKVPAISLDEGLLVHLLDVDASREGFLVAGDDNAADRRICLEGVERAVDLADELRVERVQRMRAVQRDEAALAFGRDDDRLEGAIRFLFFLWFPEGEDVQEHVVLVP